MSVQVENLEKNTAKLTITVSADEFEIGLNSCHRTHSEISYLPQKLS